MRICVFIASWLAFIECCQSFSISNRINNNRIQKVKVLTSSTLRATAESAIETLEQSQTNTVNIISSSLPALKNKPDLSWPVGFTVAGCPAKLNGFEAPGVEGNVAWMADVCLKSKMSSLTIFNGPLTNVPHLVSRCCILNDSKLWFTLDFRPRAYGAYEKRDNDGNYPGPEELGRVAFEYSGNRMEYDTKFGNNNIINFLQSTSTTFQDSYPNNRPNTELDLLTRGPLILDVIMPINDANVAAIVSAREQAAKYWLSWAMSSEFSHRPGAPINSQYVYDTKYKLNAYGSLLQLYSEVFGHEEGKEIATTESGPLDEAYVGGGS